MRRGGVILHDNAARSSVLSCTVHLFMLSHRLYCIGKQLEMPACDWQFPPATRHVYRRFTPCFERLARKGLGVREYMQAIEGKSKVRILIF